MDFSFSFKALFLNDLIQPRVNYHVIQTERNIISYYTYICTEWFLDVYVCTRFAAKGLKKSTWLDRERERLDYRFGVFQKLPSNFEESNRGPLARVYACASTRYQYPRESPLYFPPLHHCRQRFTAASR